MKRIEMIGFPLSHVRSPNLLNAMLAQTGDDRRVVLRPLEVGEFPAYAGATRQDKDVIGLIVTTPLKQLVCGGLDRRTPLVALIGSSNCVRCDSRDWIGANFDGFGLARAMRQAGLALAGKCILLKGCGGAGRAIAARLVAEGAQKLVIDDPEREKTAAFVERLRATAPTCAISAGADFRGRFDILINASPLGMGPEDPSPAPPAVIARCESVVDIVIGADPSRLRRHAEEQGKIFVDGAAMVRGQAALLLGFLLGEAASEEAAVLATDGALPESVS